MRLHEKVPTDLSHERVVRALKKVGFRIEREGKHTSLTKEDRIVIVPRHSSIKRETLRDIIKDAGLTVEAFKKLV